MISEIRLRFGRAPGEPAEAIKVTPITVFVGPNNSGKSKVLSELQDLCSGGQPKTDFKILGDVSFDALTEPQAKEALAHVQVTPQPGESINAGNVLVGRGQIRHQIPSARLLSAMQKPSQDLAVFCSYFLAFKTLMLNGASRIGLVAPQSAGDFQLTPQSSLQVLFREDDKRQEVRRVVAEAFSLYFVIDPTQLGQLRIRLSDRPPANAMEERGVHKEAVEFHSKAQRIDDMSDGVKAFTGIMSELIAGDPRILLIDEPEAFLHPTLAAKLGLEVSRAAGKSDKRVFVSTHSAAFVMGCVQSGTPVNIVRLTYRGGIATARVLPSNELLRLMRHPLLRSTGVLNGLFHEFVVVTEADADRAFYQEVNERLVAMKPEWGIPGCLFINAQNKQTVPTIVRPLRDLGIATAGIVDIDVLKDGGTTFTNQLDGIALPAVSHSPLSSERAAIKLALEKTGKDMKRDGGLALLTGSEYEAAKNLLDRLAEYGLFVVAGGELESWLRFLGATGHGPAWLIQIFEKMGTDPAASGYLKPAADDVWKFISTMKGWLENPARKGIPS